MILDVGCGNQPKGHVNIDYKRLHNIPNFVRADTHSLPFRNNSFNMVYASQLIEHVDNPKKAVKEFARVGAKLLLWTPSEFSLDKSVEHIYTWNKVTLANLLATAFDKVEVSYSARQPIIQGRLGRGARGRIFNLVLAQMGIKRELCAIASKPRGL